MSDECYNGFTIEMCDWHWEEHEFMADEEDFLDELIAESTKQDPEFPKLMEAAAQRRREARARGEDPNDVPQAEDEAPEQSAAPHSPVPR